MNGVYQAALQLQEVCQKSGWSFCFIGGLAVQRWGEPRLTDDADITLLTGFGGEEKYIARLLKSFSPRRADAVEFALRYRVLLLENSEGVGLDIALGALPFETNAVKRASPFHFPTGQSLITCSAEDLIVHKAFANREVDWMDIGHILSRQRGKLNLAQIRSELTPLLELKEQPEIARHLEQLIKHHAGRFTRIKPAKPKNKNAGGKSNLGGRN